MTIDNRTAHLSLALPHPDNTGDVDVLRLREALQAIDAKVAALDALLASTDLDLDTLQEVVNIIHNINSGLSGAETVLATKADATALAALQSTVNAKVGSVNGQAGPAVALLPQHLGLGPSNGPTATVLSRDATGRLTQVTQTIDGANAVSTLTYDAQGRVATVTTVYAGRTRTETMTYNAAGLASVAATEVQA